MENIYDIDIPKYCSEDKQTNKYGVSILPTVLYVSISRSMTLHAIKLPPEFVTIYM
jgi:hypothetical protein